MGFRVLEATFISLPLDFLLILLSRLPPFTATRLPGLDSPVLPATQLSRRRGELAVLWGWLPGGSELSIKGLLSFSYSLRSPK